MPWCPACKEKIDCLVNVVPSTISYYMIIIKQRRLDYKSCNDPRFTENEDYRCPACAEVLFSDKEDAILSTFFRKSPSLKSVISPVPSLSRKNKICID